MAHWTSYKKALTTKNKSGKTLDRYKSKWLIYKFYSHFIQGAVSHKIDPNWIVFKRFPLKKLIKNNIKQNIQKTFIKRGKVSAVKKAIMSQVF